MSKKTKWAFLASLAVLAFITGYGLVAKAWPYPYHYGYFYNLFDDRGTEVLPPAWGASPPSCPGSGGLAIPMWVDTADEFINFITCKLSASVNNRVGAAFIISTLTGMKNDYPGPTEINEFAARVRYSESRGWINWNSSLPNCPLPNTFYQDDRWDVGTYGQCGTSGSKILFSDGSSTVYILKRACANPAGIFNPIPDNPDFNMSGTTSVDDTTVFPGQTINFTHTLTNNGPAVTDPSTINWTTQSGPSSAGPWSDVANGNAGTFGNGQSKPNIGNQAVTVPGNAVPNSQICRRIIWNPDTQGGGTDASTPACATVQYDFGLTPAITVRINDGATPGAFAEPGDKVEFIYSVNNAGPTISQSTNCNIYGLSRGGYYTIPAPNDSTSDAGFVQPAHGCPRVFPVGNTPNVVTETISAVAASDMNKSLCRSFFVNPATETGGSASDEKCAYIAAKPYTRVYGGDISAGNGLATAAGVCTSTNPNGAVVGWNKQAGGSYAGAGAQYAVYAMNRITDFSSSLYNPSGAAAPIGLSFANTSSNVGSGDFGGTWGSAPCIPDYYANRPASTLAIPATVTAMTTNIYGGTGNVTLATSGAIIDPNERITVYVDGNVYINGDIRYPGSWNPNSMPLFELIVRGDIFIDNDVTQLDGVYVAQANGATGGTIYTCATGFAVLPLNSLYSQCNRKLTVNGLFTANQVRLLRTIGTLRQSANTEPGSSANIGEVFNFGPAIWMAQPNRDTTTPVDYDAIISLPPVL